MKKRIIKGKKGVSHVIEMVLLTALAVGMGAFVTIWYTQSSEKQSTELLQTYENQAECLEIKYDAAFEYENCRIAVYNLGMFKIDQIKADFYLNDGTTKSSILDMNIMPREGQYVELSSIGVPGDFTKAKFTPIIIKNKKKLVCPSDKEYTIGEGGPFVNC